MHKIHLLRSVPQFRQRTLGAPRGQRGLGLRLIWLAALVPFWSAPAAAAVDEAPRTMRVGMSKSLFRDVPDPVVKALLIPFSGLMQQHTGFAGNITIRPNACQLCKELAQGKLDFGMLHGYEFAWAQKKFPKLKPLMLAVNHHPYYWVDLVTRADSKISNFSDLRGKKISLPVQSVGACYLVLDRECDKAGSPAEKFFGQIVKQVTAESGLDDVVRGETDAALVDDVALHCYGTVKPGCMPMLKTIEKIGPFPAAVVAYYEGGLDQQTLDTFRHGMQNANKDPKSRGLITLWKLTGFEPVPADFPSALEKIAKLYPAPAGW